jgi:uncharacterized protein YneF (UPF0154 family)
MMSETIFIIFFTLIFLVGFFGGRLYQWHITMNAIKRAIEEETEEEKEEQT